MAIDKLNTDPTDAMKVNSKLDTIKKSNLSNTEEAKPIVVDELGYIKGYENLTGGTFSTSNKTVTDYSPSNKKSLPTNVENDFIKGINNYDDFDFYWDDPSLIGFQIRFILEDSPLFNFSIEPYMDTVANQNSALYFLQKYSSVYEIGSRISIYYEFIKELLKVFTTLDNGKNNGKKQYNIESILGMEKMMSKHVKYGEGGDLIKVTMTEDVTLRATYLAELYNNLVYSYKTQRYMIPENVLRFDMEIKLTDYRKFKIENKDFGTNDKRLFINTPENETPRIIYKLFDCNFDFFESKIYQDGITMGGYNTTIGSTPGNLTFNIKYKSIERIFNSPLIRNSYGIQNKNIRPFEQIGSKEYKNIRPNEPIESKEIPSQIDTKTKDLSKFDIKQPEFTELINKNDDMGKLFGDGKFNAKDFVNDISGSTIKYAEKKFKEAKSELGNLVLQEARNLRGELLDELKTQLRSFSGKALTKNGELPKIYPDNVYAEDFGDFNLDNFASGLITDVYNDFEKGLDDTLSNLGGF